MEQKSANNSDNDEEFTTNQIKLKAQEIAKRIEKYHGRYTSSSRCNTPLPIYSAESIESIHSNSVISDTSDKILLFRQFLENDRKLVENTKTDVQKSNNDDPANDDNLLDVQQNKKEKHNASYYEDIISAQFHEKHVESLKSQIVELNEKLENYHNNITEKDMLLQLKIDKIESLNKAIVQNNKLHLETVEALKKRNIEVINEERLRCTQKINHIEEESEELKNNLEDVHRLCEKLKKKNIKIDKENTELRKREISLQSDIEELSISYENEKKFIQKHNNDSSKHRISDMENELLNLQQENDLLSNQVALLESNSMNYQETDNLLMELDKKETEIQRLNLENEKLNKQLENQIIDVRQTENRWIQLKDAYLKDKERMTLLEKVIDELQKNKNELSEANVKLTEQIEKSIENVKFLKADNEKYQEQISDLMAVIENMRETFEKAMKESSNEYELNKKHFIQQHEDDQVLITTCNNKLKDSTALVDELTYKINIVLKENNSFKCERLEFNDCLSKRDTEIFKLNNAITEFHALSTQLANELDLVKKENTILKDKLNSTNIATEDNKLLSDRFQKQKQLLKVKVKALKESENNCSLLQQQVFSLNKEINVLNQRLGYLIQSNKQISTVIQNCDVELQICYELLNKIVVKSNLQNQNIHILRCVLIGLASLFSLDNFDVVVDDDLLEVIDSICNNIVLDDNELQISLKKLVLGSIQILEYIVHLKDTQNSSKAQLIEFSEVEKFVSEAVEKVKLSTQNEYHKKNNELLELIENLQNDNHSLKLNISTNTLEDKEVITDLIGPTVNNLLSLENVDIKFIKNENDTLKQFLKNICEGLGLININEKDDRELLNTLNKLELHVQEIKNENKQLKHQFIEHQKLISLDLLEQPIQHQTDKYSNLNSQNTFIQPIENFDENDESKERGSLEEVCLKPNIPNSGMSNSTENGDSKILLVRYKNLKTRFKDCRAKTIDLEKQIRNLTNDLECSNKKFKQLNDQYGNTNETHEADIIQCQSEIENLMCEKLEAYRQLTTLKEKHEILQNDYDQLKSNLEDKNSLNDTDTISVQKIEQNTVLKGKLNETQRLIDSAYSRVLCEWPPIDNDPDWVFVQSKKLDKIVEAKSLDSYTLEESEIKQLQTCVQNIHELVTSILTNTCSNEVCSTNILVDLISDLKSCTERFLALVSVKNNKSTDELHIELTQDDNVQDSNSFFSSEKSINKTLSVTEEATQSSLMNNGENEQQQRAIAERDRLIEFLSDKISKLDNLNRNVNDIRLVQDKLDRALTAVHERDVRCDELTFELTRLLEERDMLQLKLSNSIRQIQFLCDNQPQLASSNLLDGKFDFKSMDDKLEELHSLEYRKDAELFTDQEQRHMSQMQLHKNRHENSATQEANSPKNSEEVNSALSWFKDILW